jgi:hypothetical protein
MVNCPKCGELMSKGKRGKYFCEKANCAVIFVRCPSFPSRAKLASSSVATTIQSVEFSPSQTL